MSFTKFTYCFFNCISLSVGNSFSGKFTYCFFNCISLSVGNGFSGGVAEAPASFVSSFFFGFVLGGIFCFVITYFLKAFLQKH